MISEIHGRRAWRRHAASLRLIYRLPASSAPMAGARRLYWQLFIAHHGARDASADSGDGSAPIEPLT